MWTLVWRLESRRGETKLYTYERSFSETSGEAGYSHLGSVGRAGQGSVGFTPGAGRGSGRAVVRQCAGRAVRQVRAGQVRAVGVID